MRESGYYWVIRVLGGDAPYSTEPEPALYLPDSPDDLMVIGSDEIYEEKDFKFICKMIPPKE